MPAFQPARPASPSLHELGQRLTIFLRRLTLKSALLLAAWALFIIWTAWGTVSNGIALLATPSPQIVLFQISYAAPMCALNLWGLAAGLVFGLAIANPFAWLNGKRLVIACMAFAMILSRLIDGGLNPAT